MLSHLRPALVMLLGMTALTGLAYPLAMTGLAQAVAPDRADGGLITRDGQPIGAALIAQGFTGAGYFHPRPSATDYTAMPSGASNLGPTSADLVATVGERRAAWGPDAPIDAVTASGSGLDPDISPANARGQAARIAQVRGIPPAQVEAVIARHMQPRLLGLYGEPHLNVLLTNLALDAEAPMPSAGPN